MSAYDNVVGGKLRLKGKPLNVKTSGVSKKSKKTKKSNKNFESVTGGESGSLADYSEDLGSKNEGSKFDDHLTAAERRYLQQWEKIDLERLSKMASKSHRDRIQEFNQYLANLTEHYDIPKVGPG